MYRPNLDAGGARWPFLFEILMSSLFVGQILLTAMLVLKQAYGPCVLAILPFVPSYLFRESMRSTFHRPYADASLFHTADLDGLDVNEPTSPDIRESFRRFLVDAHKAAYVPVCLARGAPKEDSKKTYVFTSEPACVVKHTLDTLDTPRPGANAVPYASKFSFGRTSTSSDDPPPFRGRAMSGDLSRVPTPIKDTYTQYGVTLRRVATREFLV
jgi:hypothetical protein